MPNIKAAVKWVRQSEKRTQRNLETKTRLKTLFKKAKAAKDGAVTSSVEAAFDKAAAKGIIHPNKAARYAGAASGINNAVSQRRPQPPNKSPL